jgi:hypothetical protein
MLLTLIASRLSATVALLITSAHPVVPGTYYDTLDDGSQVILVIETPRCVLGDGHPCE